MVKTNIFLKENANFIDTNIYNRKAAIEVILTHFEERIPGESNTPRTRSEKKTVRDIEPNI